jgi:hypothetical protein
MIELYLSSDGKHTVHISVETPEELNRILPVGRNLYEGIVASYGSKPEMWQKAMNGKPAERQLPPPMAPATAQPPLCPVHGQPMHLRQGKKGYFWSCSRKDQFGNWCTQTINAATTAP